MLLSIVFALAFIQSSYHDGFTSYPPAILCVLIAFGRMAAVSEGFRRRDLVLAGLSLGIGACFKHDVAAYGAVACGVSALLMGTGTGSRVGRVAILAVSAAVPVGLLFGSLAAVGAGPDLWQDLFVFPTADFRHVRPESFPIRPPLPAEWPGWRLDKLSRAARDLSAWAVLHVPTIVLLLGLAGAWMRRKSLTPPARALVAIAVTAYPLFWLAAHVQINTHRVTLAALALIAVSVGVRSPRAAGHRVRGLVAHPRHRAGRGPSREAPRRGRAVEPPAPLGDLGHARRSRMDAGARARARGGGARGCARAPRGRS